MLRKKKKRHTIVVEFADVALPPAPLIREGDEGVDIGATPPASDDGVCAKVHQGELRLHARKSGVKKHFRTLWTGDGGREGQGKKNKDNKTELLLLEWEPWAGQ